MTEQDYNIFAGIIYRGCLPMSKDHGVFEIRNNVHLDKINNLHDELINTTLNLSDTSKKAVAEKYTNKLRDYYKKLLIHHNS